MPDGQSVKAKRSRKVEEESSIGPISPAGTPFVEFEQKEVPTEPHNAENISEREAEESARILAEFKVNFFPLVQVQTRMV